MANQFIEQHDSVLAVMWYEGDSEAVLIFSKLYIHQSEGVAGMDAGVGWFQRAELVIEDVSLGSLYARGRAKFTAVKSR